jgi:CheY-specific phosphatase CheX
VTKDEFLAKAQNALERMAFVITEQSQRSIGEALANTAFHAMVSVEGEQGGVLLLVSASPGFVTEVASGMMGLDPSELDADEHGASAVTELANILGGELVMAMGGDEMPLRLGLPSSLDDASAGSMADRAATGGWAGTLQSDAGELLVALAPT